MSDEEYRQEVERRWRESMALLGLDPGAEAAKPVLEARPPKVEPVFQAPPSKAEDEPREPEPAPFGSASLEAEPFLDEIQSELPVADENVLVEPAPAEETAPPEEESAAEARPGRRRGRRGRRVKKGEEGKAGADVSTEDSAASADEEAAEEAPRRKRGRGSGRPRTQKDTASSEAASQDVPSQVEPTSDGDEEDEDLQNPADWDVPSWQELIESLYRPER
jgi:ribonuclease E